MLFLTLNQHSRDVIRDAGAAEHVFSTSFLDGLLSDLSDCMSSLLSLDHDLESV